MKIANTRKTSKGKYLRTKILKTIERDRIIEGISSYLFSYRAKHYGFDNLCPVKIFDAMLSLQFCETGDFFLESYPDKSFELMLNDLSIAIYHLVQGANIEELQDLQIEPEEIKDVLLKEFMFYYKYTGKELFIWSNVFFT